MLDAITHALNVLEQRNGNCHEIVSEKNYEKNALNQTQEYINQCMHSGSIELEVLLHHIIQDFKLPISNYSTYYFKEVILCGITQSVKNLSELYSITSAKLAITPTNLERSLRYVNDKIQSECSTGIYKMFFAVKGPITDGACILSIIKYIKNLEKIISKQGQNLSLEEQKEFEEEQLVIKTLYDLGFPSHSMGYDCLKEAILYVLNKKEVISVTKELYPEVAKKMKTTPQSVERFIRTFIQSILVAL